MTTDVATQTAYVSVTQPDATVATQTAYVALTVGERAVVATQTAYLAVFPGTGRRRRVSAIIG